MNALNGRVTRLPMFAMAALLAGCNVVEPATNGPVSAVAQAAPTIVTQPQSITANDGSLASFVVLASGSQPLSYQWMMNGQPFPGGSGSTLNVAAVLAENGATFSVIVRNNLGGATSQAARLTVKSVAPSISTQPVAQSIIAGSRATFAVAARGSAPLAFQWRRNGMPVPGAVSASYLTPATSLSDSGALFEVTITNMAGTATSSAALLTVTTGAPALGIALLAGQLGGSGSIDGVGGAARFYNPQGVAVDSAGNVYVADNTRNIIRKVSPAGVVTTIAGLAETPGSNDGIGTAALFNAPGAVAVDAAGNIYVTDTGNNTIRQITPAGVVTTLAGTPGTPGSADGTGGAALFNAPAAIIAAGGNLYVADTGNNNIRQIAPGGIVTTLAGTAGVTGAADGTGPAAQFSGPEGITADSAGNLYVVDTNNNTVRRITLAGVVTTIAGTPGVFGTLDGPGSVALFSHPFGITIDLPGNLYVSDSGNNTVRMITPALVVSTLAGSGGGGFADGIGRAASFQSPCGIAADAGGNLYVSDFANHTIRKISATAAVTTLAGTAPHPGSADGSGNRVSFDAPEGVATDALGNIYVADRLNNTIRTVTVGGVVTTLAGTAGVTGSSDGSGGAARFNRPHYLALDAAGSIYVADTGNNTIRKVTPAGVVTTLAGTAGMSGTSDGTGGAALFNAPAGIVTGIAGNVYVADSGNNTIRKITAAGIVTTLAGTPGTIGSADGSGGGALFNSPHALSIDAAGNIYVADTNNNTIRKMTAAGAVTTLAGTAGIAGSADGTGPAAQFNSPHGLATDAAGNLYVADMLNHTIRIVSPAGVVTTAAGVPRSEGVIQGPLPGSLNSPQGVSLLPGSSTTLLVTDSVENSVLYVTLP